ncbi:nucleic-acid-binding protein from transposon X-element [Trichonephila clavipes]|nr:nucleic-acid-binding protein from transposon X-element [Trichonephila clavipes]
MSDFMDFSSTRQSQVAACEKLRDTVHGISALHSSMFEGVRTPSPKNSFMDQMSTHAMARKKDELVSELKTLPPCTRDDCKEHKIPTSLIVEDSNINESTSDEINRKVKKKKPSKKRKNKNKESSEEFIFPKKTARLVSPNSTQDPIETKNNFSDLEQDVEHPLPTDKNVNSEKITPPTKLPHPVMLKIKKNFREQMKLITNKFPKIRNRTVGDVVKMFTNDHDEYRSLIQYLKTDIEFEFYVIDNKKEKPIKAVIKGLPSSSKIEDITSDLADEGYQIESCTQLISKRTKKSLPFFLVILPRNAHNSKIFDLTYLSYLQVKVEGYLVRGNLQ